jgi:hypothetical protein
MASIALTALTVKVAWSLDKVPANLTVVVALPCFVLAAAMLISTASPSFPRPMTFMPSERFTRMPSGSNSNCPARV